MKNPKKFTEIGQKYLTTAGFFCIIKKVGVYGIFIPFSGVIIHKKHRKNAILIHTECEKND